MEICKAPTLRLKALNKHTHIMYIEMENVIQKNKYVYIDKCSSKVNTDDNERNRKISNGKRSLGDSMSATIVVNFESWKLIISRLGVQSVSSLQETFPIYKIKHKQYLPYSLSMDEPIYRKLIYICGTRAELLDSLTNRDQGL